MMFVDWFDYVYLCDYVYWFDYVYCYLYLVLMMLFYEYEDVEC